MTPYNFPDSNTVYSPPKGLTEEQVACIPAYAANILGGSCDGLTVVVVAWKPSEEDLKILNEGGLIYMSSIGGLTPHYLTTDFQLARSPA